jgi:branched-chain amino acid transport system substrate-binding protein
MRKDRRIILQTGLSLSTLALFGCSSTGLTSPSQGDIQAASDPVQVSPTSSAAQLGTGSVKVGLILPLSAPNNAGIVAQNLRNAAELALQDFSGHDLTILIRNDAGTSAGAIEAAKSLLSEGVELILGPLFSESVRQVGALAKAANKPVIAFSTDPNAATKGVYLLSFMAEPVITRAIRHAVTQGQRAFVGFVSADAAGQIAEAAFQQAVVNAGARVAGIERYSPDKIQEAARKLSQFTGTSDAIFVPDPMDGQTLNALKAAGFTPDKFQYIGAAPWENNRQAASLAPKAFYAAPDNAGFNQFKAKYRAKYGQEPMRLATIGYDAVQIAAGLSQTYGAQRYSERSLTSTTGFTGVDGLFRFRADGTIQRGLALYQANGQQISAAQKSF